MLEALPENLILIDIRWLLIPVALAGIGLVIFSFWFVPKLLRQLQELLIHSQIYAAYQKVVVPYKGLVWLVSSLAIADVILINKSQVSFLRLIEISVSLSLLIILGWISSQSFNYFFDVYLLNSTLKKGGNINSELLILIKLIANFLIVVIAIITFAQTHQINIFGLIASLGVGGIAIAFASQKTLEQLLGGIIIYIDRPFIVDDYIGLPDGTFGRVESIGLRSTKIRTSGKGTLMVVPNNYLTQVNIENFTGAKKVISILYLTFYRTITNDDRALIRQVILESTGDIPGINSGRTDVVFRVFSSAEHQEITQAQTTFFILGAGEVSMELRRQLLDIAQYNINNKLQEYGIEFDIEQPSIYVDSPITI
ncbi:MAG: mechanosensitive ion channel [Moorea sp. SIO1G6]|uniref:mechanosensitive ion channel family protein n=1 Tax=Moorena sp. SIO1G6 TaxID=2607840 RepID=UPI0013C159EC|nr:mechanosensitive ion channel domain-containing protein [Moorena sp. SIO1G6]NET64719.1 mechanosensitive ion channel [Moorena sp. SIO1G6]